MDKELKAPKPTRVILYKQRETFEYCAVDCDINSMIPILNGHGKRGWQLSELVKQDRDSMVTLILMRTISK